MPIISAEDILKQQKEQQRAQEILAQEQAANQAKDMTAQDAAKNLGMHSTATTAQDTSSLSDGLSKPGMGAAIGMAGTAYGNAIDPEGSRTGPVIAGASSGAATGLAVGGPWGAAIGAVAGLGLGLMQASNKRGQIQREANAKALQISGEGLQSASNKGTPQFTFGSGRGSFSQGRNLRFQ